MKEKHFRALIVDDEEPVRQLTVRALTAEGFNCDAAADGAEAMRWAEEADYDVVVTDLRMPNRHGHALAVELLQQSPRPVIVVLTAVVEPRLAKDLLSRGVDDVAFKPVDYPDFASKVRALVECQLHQKENQQSSLTQRSERKPDERQDALSHEARTPFSLSEIESKLALLSRVLPVSQAALDAFYLARSEASSAQQIAAAIQRDASLSAEVLHHANSSFYNPSAKPIIELDHAVTRIGARRAGEWALASNVLATLTARQLPWLNVEGNWRRSMASGVALESLVDQGGHQERDEGLLLCCIMHDLGRVLLSTLYPKHYERMAQVCIDRSEPLSEQEKWMFPENYAKTAARWLATWNLPVDLYRPLRYTLDPYRSLARLTDPLRTRAELVKLAVFLGQLAAQSWQHWDLVELPPTALLCRLRIHDVVRIIEQSAADLKQMIRFSASKQTRAEHLDRQPVRSDSEAVRLTYCNLSDETFDFFAGILPSMEINVVRNCLEESEGPTLVNAIGADPRQVSNRLAQHRAAGELVIVSDAESYARSEGRYETIVLPCSWGAIRNTCHKLARTRGSDGAGYADRRNVAMLDTTA